MREVYTLDSSGRGSLMEMAANHDASFTPVGCSPDDVSAILYTSGTTGRPKGAMLTHGNLASNGLTLKEAWGFAPNDILLHALPIFHVHGLFVACHCALLSGASMYFMPKFDATLAVDRLQRCTVFMGVPTYYTRLLTEQDFGEESCRTMRLFISGSAPLQESAFHAFKECTGHTILERYGMTETGMNTSNPLEGARTPGTVGPPLPGVQLRIVDDDDRPLSSGMVGNIQAKGPNVFKGYWQMPGKSAEEFTEVGWFKTGDLGKQDADGYVSIVGRSKDLIIITGGYTTCIRKKLKRISTK
jgi:malonyl-CoA/methylmalonyl-CoA synthetase